MVDHFDAIKQKYSDFNNFLLAKGVLPARDTIIGYWGVTPLDETHELFHRINLGSHKSFVDLGSGDGRIVLLAALFGVKAHGIEFDSWLTNTSIIMKHKISLPDFSTVKFLQDNFMDHNLSQYDVVFVSPDKPFHRKGLERKLQRELNGKLIVHGWEFHPKDLQKSEEHIINGEKFCIYSK